MAELIPLEYRIAVSQKRLARRWGFVMALALAVAAGGSGHRLHAALAT